MKGKKGKRVASKGEKKWVASMEEMEMERGKRGFSQIQMVEGIGKFGLKI